MNATSITHPACRVLSAVVLVLASAIAPISLLAASCQMPCCERTSFPTPMAGCAEQCGISSSPSTNGVPAGVTVPSAAPHISLTGTATGATFFPSHRRTAPEVESRHAVPGDAPLYLYHSTFLI